MSAPSNPHSGDASRGSNLMSASAPQQSAGATLAVVAQALQDAAQLTDRYGSTSAARERLDMLEREQEGLNDMIVVLRTRLRQSQRATASAESEARRHKAALISANAIATIATSSSSVGGIGSGSSAASQSSQASSTLFDADGFVNFLKRRFACRGDMTLLLDALFEFQTQQGDGGQQQSQQANERVVLLTIEEVQISIPSSSPAASSSSARADVSYSVNVNTAATPTNSSNNNNNNNSSSMMNNSNIAPSAAAYNGDNSSGSFGNLGIGIHNSSYYHRQSPEEEEQEIHLAAKQLLSPVTFTHVEEDEEALKSAAGAPSHQFAPIHRSEAEHPQQERSSSSSSSSFIRAQDPDDESKQFKKILPKKPRVKKAARAPSPLPSPSDRAHENQGGEAAAPSPHNEPVAKKRKIAAEENGLVIKQNLVWPAERRNITEMKHSSRFLELSVLEALDKQTPWNEMYKRRPLYSHVINYSELDDRAKTWFVTTLKIQFVWRRELWERLHWLPMSESVCTGAAWEKYRQTRKRRAKHAVTAWRKVYAQSIQMIEAGILPDDIWCDPALWYMPANPIYWLPDSGDVLTELAAIDEKHAVRCYHVYDLSRHPFYALGLVDKYPDKYELPSFSAISMQHPGSAEDDLANFGLKDAAPLLADLVPKPSSHPSQHQHQHHPRVIITKDSSGPLKKRGPRVQKLSTQPRQQQPQEHQKSTVVVPQKLRTGAATVAAFAAAKATGGEVENDPTTIASDPSAGP